jgi:hypothetical protein
MKLKTVLAPVLSIALSASIASAYEGYWEYDNNPGGSEYLVLGDDAQGFEVQFYGVKGWCGRKGVSYAKMRQVLSSNGNNSVYWRVASTCDVDYDGYDDFARICVTGGRGQEVCSTYGVADWWWYEGD